MRRAGMLGWLLVAAMSFAGRANAEAAEVAAPTPAEVALPAGADAGTLEAALPRIARDLLATYVDPDADRRASTRLRLDLVAGEWNEALEEIKTLRELRRPQLGAAADTLFVQYEVYGEWKMLEDPGIDRAFERAFAALDDRAAARAQAGFGANVQMARRDLDAALARHAGKASIPLADFLELIRVAQFHQVFSELVPQMPALIAADDARRYTIQRDVVIPGPDGVSLRGLVVRPKQATAPLTTLLGFTIYVNDLWSFDDAKGAAANGYAGVVAYSRGKAGSPGTPVPYEHDGEDAAATIDWIAAQPWSDGRVGMYGSSYNSFTQWAAAKHRPKALKAMLTSASGAPGIDTPMQGGIFQNFMYPWPLWTAGNATLDGDSYGDQERWRRLDREYYRSGRAYRELPAIDGHPNPAFARWLQHPDYDAYWQAMTPQGAEFADIDIPVLAVTGYFDGARVGVQHYWDQHHRFNPDADHTLLVGPWGHFAMQAGVARFVEGYEVDPSALIDLPGLRYAWFDHVFRGAPKPALLRDRVNWQVMGGDRWEHSPSIEAMAAERRRLYPHPGWLLLAETPAPATVPMTLTRDFAARDDIDDAVPAGALSEFITTADALVFSTHELTLPTEVAGLFSGQLDFIVNKRDVDLDVSLYELLPDGRYLLLAWHLGRASYANDRTRRELLVPGERQTLAFRSERLTGRLVQPRSKLVIVVSANRRGDMQINYGTGGDVSDETIADAGEPLRLDLLPTSWFELPLREVAPEVTAQAPWTDQDPWPRHDD